MNKFICSFEKLGLLKKKFIVILNLVQNPVLIRFKILNLPKAFGTDSSQLLKGF